MFFCNIPEEIENKLIPPKKHFSHYLKDPANNTFYMSPTNAREVEQKLKTLKTNKAVGPNSIPTKILKTYSKSLSKPLSELINLSFAQGKFPTILKIAKVIPIPKKGDKSECDNCRPISLKSNTSKLLEKLVHERLYSFLEKEKLLFEGQYGFRNKRSTTDVLTDITERIRYACDKGYYACGAFLDFKKAFDTVHHEILLSKLTHYGIRGQAVDWFRLFLSQRVQYTSVSGFDSELSLVTHGAPQGSVLGPLLFIVFINDLHKSVKHSQILYFADDTNILYLNNSMKKINKHINHDLSLSLFLSLFNGSDQIK